MFFSRVFSSTNVRRKPGYMCGLNTYLINNNENFHSALTKIEKNPLKNDLFVNGPVLKKPGPFRKMTLINWFYLFNIKI